MTDDTMDKGIIEQIAFCMRWIDRNLVPQAQKHRCMGGKKSGGEGTKINPLDIFAFYPIINEIIPCKILRA